jgi:methyl-accepting chemotaxis protein
VWSLVDNQAELADALRVQAARIKRPRGLKPFLEKLAADISALRNLDGWSRIDIVAEAESHLQTEWYNRWVGRVGLLVPIAWGWWSISSAAEAYGELRNDQLQSNSFLWWWIEGMDGRLGTYHRLTYTALITVGALLLLALLGAMSGIWAAYIRRRLWPLLVQSQIHVAQRSAITPDELRGAVSSTLREIQEATHEMSTFVGALREIGSSLKGEHENLKQYVKSQTDLVGGDLSEATTKLGSASEKLAKSLDVVKASSANLSAAVNALPNLISPAQEIGKAAVQVTEIAASLSKSLKQLADDIPESLHEPIGNTLSASQLLADAVQLADKRLAPLLKLVETNALSSSLDGIANDVHDLREGMKKLNETIRRQSS